MDQRRVDERREAARQKLERTRERAGRARRRALALPIALFGILWVAVFAQMATGNDPALSNNSITAATAKSSKADRKTAARSGNVASQPQQRQPATELAYDPVTGMYVRVPASSQATTPAPAPAPAPVITSQS